MDIDQLIGMLRSSDERARTEAWVNAGRAGAAAVEALVKLATEGEPETARAARRALWRITRHAGRPGADGERAAVVAALLGQLAGAGLADLRAEMLWMVSEIGLDEAVEPVAGLLTDPALREDARMVLQRIPGPRSLAALRAALAGAEGDFKAAIAEALRGRGEPVDGTSPARLKPSRPTTVPAQSLQ